MDKTKNEGKGPRPNTPKDAQTGKGFVGVVGMGGCSKPLSLNLRKSQPILLIRSPTAFQ